MTPWSPPPAAPRPLRTPLSPQGPPEPPGRTHDADHHVTHDGHHQQDAADDVRAAPARGTAGLGTPDLGTPDLGTPDLVTSDLGTPDLGTMDLGTLGGSAHLS